jgi:hypothetical protein
MAVDTAEKRFSMMDFDAPSSPGMSPPDGASAFGDRMAMMWLYSGIEPQGAPEPESATESTNRNLVIGMGPAAKQRNHPWPALSKTAA